MPLRALLKAFLELASLWTSVQVKTTSGPSHGQIVGRFKLELGCFSAPERSFQKSDSPGSKTAELDLKRMPGVGHGPARRSF